ncbi:hypothetical protein AVDCRST_MAG94-252 [uncultured Leptolyngbya sp.]|uniref:Uncharacterized protein n=1 Tax=uncultured Leptolyngbya sp. TaxID=332963 RepID=A0A6J4KA61_9CYAN|nr:hypothetical protein AVDCRST_MAG94-252 [uncultured Leptolyngbya sp.]
MTLPSFCDTTVLSAALLESQDEAADIMRSQAKRTFCWGRHNRYWHS